MASGRYRTRVVAERPIRTPDGAGGEVEVWDVVAEFWAEVTPTTGREQMRSGQRLADLDKRVITRWAPGAAGLTALDRLLIGGIPHPIIRPPVDIWSRHREIEIYCNEGLNDG